MWESCLEKEAGHINARGATCASQWTLGLDRNGEGDGGIGFLRTASVRDSIFEEAQKIITGAKELAVT